MATGGTYVDEATGATVPLAAPLDSVLLNATGGNVSVAITALTELAYENASAQAGGLTGANIQSAVTLVQNNFGVSDIINTMPVDALNVPAGATAAQKTYALALATLSQYLEGQPGATLTTALQTIQACIAAPTTACGAGVTSLNTLLNTALTTFYTGHTAFSGITLQLVGFGSGPTLLSIAVAPANSSIAASSVQQFTATGTYSDGSTQNLTTTATWSSSATGVATISNTVGSKGNVTTLTAGTSTITATSGSISGSTTLTVTAIAGSTSYIYYSLTSVTPQTATLDAYGTLSMGGLKLTGFAFGISATDASGTLTRWASPWNNINQPKVQAMLFCGANNKLAYVLLLSNVDDPNRAASTAPNLLSAIQSAPQYTGMGIYTDCSGTYTSAWNNNLPLSNYYLWPNVLTTYSYATVASQLNNAAIFYEAGQPSNQDNYLAITWKGASPFEVWQ